MKISQTIVATLPNGEVAPHAEPVEMFWSKNADDLTAMVSVAQILQQARTSKFTKVLAIHIEL